MLGSVITKLTACFYLFANYHIYIDNNLNIKCHFATSIADLLR